ncbi:MAG: YajQ family cyclic di-GMP-binding protein [Gammaproteobacteria bacterium]|nr:MAG: YajQ family cyclic di-GMP-binding protein [Gammaproteobacteria bacterium]RKZ41125.1 MAG: YajQ family cyclic di-GMP-binding protein [Gammaproteobacteria bacterium]RKZ74517.1 MAG: YajQ family cyclic di-GMP-binding protein [Gammaproteobacteria bacterium]
MPTFDIVSEVNLHELSNAIDQSNRELSTRFDFKNSDAHVEYKDTSLSLQAENEFQLKQMTDILHKKLAKRGIDITVLEAGQAEIQNRRARLPMTIKQGIDKDTAKKIVKVIKERKFKVQATIQGEQVRVSGKKRDDLQQIMALLREQDLGLPLQFINFRD